MKNMKRIIRIVAVFVLLASLLGCANVSRTEQDVYTISERDTTFFSEITNAPGTRDKGVVFPSSRNFKSERYLVQRDSIVERTYPDFIRLGFFESAGFLLAGKKDNAAGFGIAGLFPDFENINKDYRGSSDNKVVGGMYRFGMAEWRLRWFRDAANWTIGTSMVEVFAPDARIEKSLIGVLPLYIRKRYYIRDEMPYVCLTPTFGLSYYPSHYANIGLTLDVGSYGGLNIRGYVGLAAGTSTPAVAPQVRWSSYESNETHTTVFPYAGIGISILDFHNLVDETKVEWKYHQHSGWNIGLLQISGIATGGDRSVFSTDSTETDNNSLVRGVLVKIGNASLALPILNNKIYLGTSLCNLLAFSKEQWGMGILPVRMGYFQTLLSDELSAEPFVEYNYYPSAFFHAGARINLRISDMLNLGFVAGYASGKTDNNFGKDVYDRLGRPGQFSGAYAGISIGIADRIFFPEELRFNKQAR